MNNSQQQEKLTSSADFNHFVIFKKRFHLFIFRERGREEEKYQCVVASHVAPTGDLARNPDMCPDQELNQGPLGLQPALNPLSHTSQGYVL